MSVRVLDLVVLACVLRAMTKGKRSTFFCLATTIFSSRTAPEFWAKIRTKARVRGHESYNTN